MSLENYLKEKPNTIIKTDIYDRMYNQLMEDFAGSMTGEHTFDWVRNFDAKKCKEEIRKTLQAFERQIKEGVNSSEKES